MTIAISLPDALFEAADALARRLGVSRNALYATAVAEFLARHTFNEATAQLNRVYSEQPSCLPAPLRGRQRRAVRRSGNANAEW